MDQNSEQPTQDFVGLQRRGDGFAEAPGNVFAVHMNAVTRVDELREMNIFRYKPSFTADALQIEWPRDANNIAFFEMSVAKALITRNYARQLTKDEFTAFNEALQQFSETTQEPLVHDPAQAALESVKAALKTADDVSGQGDNAKEALQGPPDNANIKPLADNALDEPVTETVPGAGQPWNV